MNTIPDIFVIDDLPPEDLAMLQSLYSRDPRTVTVHLDAVKKAGPGKFMAQYYVGYGHKSIGDCGTTSLFIEHVSMLAAKAIQQFPLYNGQEASTRYLDMSAQPLMNPLGTQEGADIQNAWMALYKDTLEQLIPWLKEKHPLAEGQEAKVWEKAIKARAFDISRCLLPAGCTTYVAWHTNLRQAADQLKSLRHYPLAEVRSIADILTAKLKEKYPSSFSHKTYPDDEAYVQAARDLMTYADEDISEFSGESRLDMAGLKKYASLLESRPAKSELPSELRKFGDIRFKFLLDFGSYRDLQRHRSMAHIMPLLTTQHGFHPWYLQEMPEEYRTELAGKIEALAIRVNALSATDADRQYYIAMGYRVACDLSCSLPSAVYIAELRSGQTVHSTLRVVAQAMGNWIRKNVLGTVMHHDESPDAWSIKRGSHDITKK